MQIPVTTVSSSSFQAGDDGTNPQQTNSISSDAMKWGHIRQGFGFVTEVPNFAVSRLSYYLKCVTNGCGIERFFDDTFIDYSRAHLMPWDIQERIFRLALHTFDADSLMNKCIFFVPHDHELLPPSASNVFYEVETVQRHLPQCGNDGDNNTNDNVVMAPHNIRIEKVLLCTDMWMEEFYKGPLQLYLQRVTSAALSEASSSSSTALMNTTTSAAIMLSDLVSTMYPSSSTFFVGQKVRTIGLPDHTRNNRECTVHSVARDVVNVIPLLELQQQQLQRQQENQLQEIIPFRPCNLLPILSEGSVVALFGMPVPQLNGKLATIVTVMTPLFPRLLTIQLLDVKDIVVSVTEENVIELPRHAASGHDIVAEE